MSLVIVKSLQTSTLAAVLLKTPLGQEISYASLSASIGQSVQGSGRGYLHSALRIVEREDGAVFETIRNSGLRRLLPDEAPKIGKARRQRIRRGAHRAMKSMTRLAESSNGLSPEAGRKMNAELATLGLIRQLSQDRVAEKLETDTAPTPPAKAAARFLASISDDGTKAKP